jgi:hypothetical protein
MIGYAELPNWFWEINTSLICKISGECLEEVLEVLKIKEWDFHRQPFYWSGGFDRMKNKIAHVIWLEKIDVLSLLSSADIFDGYEIEEVDSIQY